MEMRTVYSPEIALSAKDLRSPSSLTTTRSNRKPSFVMLNCLLLAISPAIRFSTLVARMFLAVKCSSVRFGMKCVRPART